MATDKELVEVQTCRSKGEKSLDLSEKKLKVIPESVTQLRHLQVKIYKTSNEMFDQIFHHTLQSLILQSKKLSEYFS